MMTEEGLAETAETNIDEMATTEAPVYFGKDGTLEKGWQSTLPEGYKDEKSLLTVNDTKVLAKMFVDTKRMVGKNTIAVPTDASTEGEWDEYHKAGGRPETVEDYNLKAPDDIDVEISDMIFPKERMAKWQERFFKGGISKKAAEQFIADFAADMMADLQNKQQLEKQQMDELVSGLNTEWGDAYKQKEHLGNMAIEEGTLGNLEFKQRLTDKFGNDPDFVRFASNLGGKFAEGRPPDFTNVPTPADYQTQINELMASPILVSPTSTAAQRKQITDKVMELRKKMTQGRTT